MARLRKITILFCLLHVPLTGLLAQSTAEDFIPLTGIEQGLATPLRIAVDGQDNIYVTDVVLQCIQKYDAGGNLVATLAEGSYPVSVAISPAGDLFYGDGNTGYIYNLGAGGQSEVFYTGTQYPSSLAFSHDNILYVADNKLLKVLALDVSGDLVGTIGEGTLVFPTGIAFDARNDRILVAEHGGLGENISGSGWFSRGPLVEVHIFDRQGNEISSFGTFGSTDGKFYRLQGMTIGRCGNIYLCEPWQGNISVFTEAGTFITKFGEYGNGTGQLNLPMDIAFDSQERIIISCYNKGSLELFTIDDPLPSARIVTPYVAACAGSQADVSIQLAGTPPWSITYTLGGASPVTIDNISTSPFILSLTQPGELQLTAVSDATASGTCITGAAYISFHDEPTATIRNGDQSICAGSEASIPVYFTGDGPWTFTYTHNGIDPREVSTTHNPHFLVVTDPGLYTLTSVSGNNCDGSIVNGSATISTITLPTATFTAGNGSVSKCQYDPPINLELTFTGTAPWTFTYTVDDANPVVVNTSENPFLLPAEYAGTYEVKEVSDYFCTGTDNYSYPEVIIHPEPGVEIMLASLGLCPNTVNYIPMEFTGTPPWTFSVQRYGAPPVSVTTSENPYMYAVNLPGIYTVTTLSDLYCIGNPVGVSIQVSHANPPSASLPGDNIALCEGQTAEIPVSFTGTAPWTFTYDHNAANPLTVTSTDNPYILTVSAPGLYALTALSDANCDARNLPGPATVVQYGMPEASYTYLANELEVSFTNTSINASQYLWTFGDGSTATTENPIHTYATPGDYVVTLEAISEHCGTASISEVISVFTLKNLNAVNSGKDDNTGLSLNVYPNPSEGLFILELKGICSDDIYIEVTSMTGQVRHASRPNLPLDLMGSGTVTQRLDLSSFAQGVYHLRVQCGDEEVSRLLSVTRN